MNSESKPQPMVTVTRDERRIGSTPHDPPPRWRCLRGDPARESSRTGNHTITLPRKTHAYARERKFDTHSIIVWKKVSYRTEFFEAAFLAETDPEDRVRTRVSPRPTYPNLTAYPLAGSGPVQDRPGSVVARNWPRL